MGTRFSSQEFVDEQDNNNGAQNEHPIGNFNARYRCFLVKPFHDFGPQLSPPASSSSPLATSADEHNITRRRVFHARK
jgi:hypothetical protein